MFLVPRSNRLALAHWPRKLVLLAFAAILAACIGACGGGPSNDGEESASAAQSDPAAAAEQMYRHMADGDFHAAARMLTDEGIAQLGGVESAAERLKSTNPAMIHHGGISSMSSKVSAPEELGVMVSTTVAFKDGTLDEMKAWMKDVDGVWKMSI